LKKSRRLPGGFREVHDSSSHSLAKISIRGVVQGVGFRPFLYQLAHRHHLNGWVCNTSRDVRLEVEGGTEDIHAFLEDIRAQAPPLARIDEMSCRYEPPIGYDDFEIRVSVSQKGESQPISPDIATCPLCRTELFDPHDRRYRYPFINCTNCGPRLSIIRDIPYDRSHTTMEPFPMCPECRREYDDPMDRRFHAQPDCCARCGPRLEITDSRGKPMESGDPIAQSAAFLRAGRIVAMKGIGGFLLACDATSEEAVQRLRRRKRRLFKPFAVMMETLEAVNAACLISAQEEAALTSSISPVLLVRRREGTPLAQGIAPGLKYLGVMLPYSPIHHLLMKEAALPLVMTSGNLSEEPLAKDNDEAADRLGGIADYFLLHNRGIHARCDDSVALVERGEVRVIRRARGYAPHPVHLPFEAQEILACGAELKNTFCITRDRYAFLSQHIGDMENLETLRHFEAMLVLYRRLFRLDPRIVAHDMHPEYLSTKFARELKERDGSYRLVPVQHHHAHIISCLVENGLAPPALGVAFDGTGYGPDHTIWGGEFLLAHYHRATRLAHLECVPMPGGEAAIKQPCRMAISYLLALLGEKALERGLPFMGSMDRIELALIRQQITKRINAPLTSSAGRLFDAVSALLGIRGRSEYEAQAAIELEMAAPEMEQGEDVYPMDVDDQGGTRVIRLKRLFSEILDDLERGVSRAEISLRFHRSVAHLISRVCLVLSRETGLKRVALSGGVFQNRLLFRLTAAALERAGLEVALHREVPCNDGGLSLGQAVIAHFIVADKEDAR